MTSDNDRADLIRAIIALPTSKDSLNVLCNLEPQAFQSICSCVRSVVNNRGTITVGRKRFRELRETLQPLKKEIRYLISPHRSVSAKKLLLKQKGGFIGAIIATLLPIILEQIIRAVSKK
jgi:hypothetical protein